jgi:signal transduction histidine kinase
MSYTLLDYLRPVDPEAAHVSAGGGSDSPQPAREGGAGPTADLARAELDALYSAAPGAVALFDPVELRCVRLNDRAGELLSMPKEQAIGRVAFQLIPLTGFEALVRGAAHGELTRNRVLEGELPGRPGERRVWEMSVAPVIADGTVQGISVTWVDRTHLSRTEAALVQSEKLAAVGRLASSISHEINNPLEAITNLLYLIAHHNNLPSELKVFVHTAQSELTRVSQIATQTLRFHRQAMRPTWVTPSELLDAVLNLYQGRLANSGIKVLSEYATETRILCYENDIRQVLNNLVANAVDAMRSGGELLVRAHNATDFRGGRKGVRLTIADTGHGIPAAVQRRIFEPFFTTKDLNGTGLGLWISEGIVQRHQGRLTLRSRQGKRHGTVFSLFLPCGGETRQMQEKAA